MPSDNVTSHFTQNSPPKAIGLFYETIDNSLSTLVPVYTVLACRNTSDSTTNNPIIFYALLCIRPCSSIESFQNNSQDN